uniref:D-ribitol-5-phosphate cytidylyltransferase n=1 Tax=Tetraodon nigroviridis TaxID=99883 RepID=H3BYN2_TETNG
HPAELSMQAGGRGPNGRPHPRTFLACATAESEPRSGERAVDFPVCVVLPAGGTGERTGLQTPKQFWSFLDRPLISYTIDAFERVSWIQNVVVVVAKENVDQMSHIVQRFAHRKVRVVTGGCTRHRSISNGVRALAEDRPEVVIVHDAVRPFVEEDFLYQIALAAKEHGAAGAIRPLVSTVIASTAEGFLDHSLERSKYRASETPQGFTFDVISQAYQRCSDWDLEFGTECLHLALRYCRVHAKLVPGPPTLWKVTYRWDLAAADSILKEPMLRSACVLSGDSVHAATLVSSLQKAVGALSMKLHVLTDLSAGIQAFLMKEWNYIHVSVDVCRLSDMEALVTRLEVEKRAPLCPLVLIWVHLNTHGDQPCSRAEGDTAAILDLASALKPNKLLLYSIQLHKSEEPELWEGSVSKLSELIGVLVKERSPALVGQLLRA